MSTATPGGGAAWPANRTNSETHARALKTAIEKYGLLDFDDVDPTRDLPHPAHRLAQIWDAYGTRLLTPLSETNGRRLRAEVVDETYVEYRVEEPTPAGDTFDVSEVDERRAVTWLDAIAAMLGWYERARGRRGRLARGYEGEPDYEAFTIDLENSWQPSYCKREVARLKALERETVGGDRPSGGTTTPAYENPHSVILTLSGTSTPGGERIGPADHDREIADSWTAGVYDSLRYQLDTLGISDYLYHKQGEPHPGDGANVGYGHHHVMLMVDAAPLGSGDQTPRLEAAFREVIDKHVDVCDLAGSSAHGDGAISVRRVGDADEEIESWSAYAAEYIASAEEDLLERPDQYIMWAATQWATGSQKATRSMTANSAIAADACKQRFESECSHQEVGHGERIVRSSRRGVEFECSCCGSPWQIPQHYETLTEARRETGAQVPATDGAGDDLDDDPGDAERWDAEDVGGRWPSARAAAAASTKVDPHYGTCLEFESARRPASWRMDAIIESSGEEKAATGGGVDMRPLRLPTLPKTRGELASFLGDPATYVICRCDVLARSLDAWRDDCPDHCDCGGSELRLANAAEDWSIGSLSVDEWLSFFDPDPLVRDLSFTEQREIDEALDRARRLAENTTLSPMGVVAQAGVPPTHLEEAFTQIQSRR